MKDIRVCVQLPDRRWVEENEAVENTNAVKPQLRITVPYTSPKPAKAALRAASRWAGELEAEVVLLAVCVVPFQLPLDCPDIQPEFLLNQLAGLAECATCPVRVQLVLARNKKDAMLEVLSAASIVVIATEKRWWKTEEQRLALLLTRAGCTVSLLNIPRGTDQPSMTHALSKAAFGPPDPEVAKARHA